MLVMKPEKENEDGKRSRRTAGTSASLNWNARRNGASMLWIALVGNIQNVSSMYRGRSLGRRTRCGSTRPQSRLR